MSVEAWKRRVEDLSRRGLRRTLRTLTPTGPTTAMLDGRPMIVASSNDYLGLAFRPEVREAARGGGCGSSRLISGDRPVHHELEDALGEWLGRSATLFTSGYQANNAVLSTIFSKEDLVASDALNHASIIDGLRLSGCRKQIVPHLEPERITRPVDGTVVEGIYSMDGDVPDLNNYTDCGTLVVDEAHALGVLGPDGAGTCAAQSVLPEVRIGTFGKSFGAHGAFVEGPTALRELLVQAARPFIFTTGIPEPVAAMALAGLRLSQREPHLRETCLANAEYLRKGLQDLGWQVLGEHHILAVVVGPTVMSLDARLQAAGIFAPGIRPPTVPSGSERIRLTASAAHSVAQLDSILHAFGPYRSSDTPHLAGNRP